MDRALRFLRYPRVSTVNGVIRCLICFRAIRVVRKMCSQVAARRSNNVRAVAHLLFRRTAQYVKVIRAILPKFRSLKQGNIKIL